MRYLRYLYFWQARNTNRQNEVSNQINVYSFPSFFFLAFSYFYFLYLFSKVLASLFFWLKHILCCLVTQWTHFFLSVSISLTHFHYNLLFRYSGMSLRRASTSLYERLQSSSHQRFYCFHYNCFFISWTSGVWRHFNGLPCPFEKL